MTTIADQNKPVTIVVKAHSDDEYGGGPEYAAFRAAPEFIGRLEDLLAVCREKDIEARAACYPEWGPGEIRAEKRLRLGQLVVEANGHFSFIDITHDGEHLETDPFPIERLVELMKTAEPGSVQFLTSDDSVIKAYESAGTKDNVCSDCGTHVDSIIGCPDGAEICQACFDSGAH